MILRRAALSLGLFALSAVAAEPADSSADLEGIWAGTCSDDGKAPTEVRGEVCVRGAGDAREVSIWGGKYRLLRRPNNSDDTVQEQRTLEFVTNRWDEKTRTFSFDRNRIIWQPGKNEPSTVVHRVQWLKLVGADAMDEAASELSIKGDERKETRFVCKLTRVSKKVERSGPNSCPG